MATQNGRGCEMRLELGAGLGCAARRVSEIAVRLVVTILALSS